MPGVSFEGVSKRFGATVVIEAFDLAVADGELLVLVGGSGSGKSTILRLLAGLESVTTGRIRIGAQDVTALPPRLRDVAMVFQDYALYPHMTVRENLTLGLRLHRMPRDEIARRLDWAAGMLGLVPLLERKPKQLSGGQRQRVAMGRAMVREPHVFLFDEPLSNLDAGLRAQMRIEIGALQRRLRTTTLYVTHDQAEAMTLGDRLVVLADGRIQQVGRPMDVYREPATRFVAGFIGTPPMNFVPGALRLGDDGPAFVAHDLCVPLAATPAGQVDANRPVTLGVRPEDLRLVPLDGPLGDADAGALRGRVVLVERLGGATHLYVDVGPHRLIAVLAGEPPPAVGDLVALRAAADRLHLFDADERAVPLHPSGGDR